MLRAVVVFAVLALALAHPTYDEWKAKYGMNFSEKEDSLRRAIFSMNTAKVDMLNKMGDAAYALNEFAHLSEDEFRTQRMGLRGTDSHGCATTVSVSNVADAPAEIDWRTKGAVNSVKNQGACGSCWAFSAVADMESSHFLATGKLLSLSEQDLVDCDRKSDAGCNGGLPTNAFESVIEAGGIESEGDYPYQGVDGKCSFAKAKVAAQISNYTCLPTDEDQIAAYVAANGVVSIGLNAATLQFYMGGIADPFDFLCSPKRLDHGVAIVGYGTENNKPYWIVRNSWGEGWGEKGYFRMIRGKGKCGLNTMVSHSIV
jgi:cathepsin F